MTASDGAGVTYPRLGRLVDAAAYAVAVTALVILVSLPLSLLLGAGLTGVKYALFLAGLALLTLSVVRLWPTDPDDVAVTGGQSPADETRFQRAVQRLVAVDALRVPPRLRLATPYRLLVASLLTMATSFALEALLGVPG